MPEVKPAKPEPKREWFVSSFRVPPGTQVPGEPPEGGSGDAAWWGLDPDQMAKLHGPYPEVEAACEDAAALASAGKRSTIWLVLVVDSVTRHCTQYVPGTKRLLKLKPGDRVRYQDKPGDLGTVIPNGGGLAIIWDKRERDLETREAQPFDINEVDEEGILTEFERDDIHVELVDRPPNGRERAERALEKLRRSMDRHARSLDRRNRRKGG